MASVNRAGNEFAVRVGRRTARMKDYTKRVFQESTFRLVEKMQLPVSAGGNMPVRTGFLRASLEVDTSPVAQVKFSRPNKHDRWQWDPSEAHSAIMSAKVGATIYMGYSADYAAKVEANWGFQRLAIQYWPVIVSQVVSEFRSTQSASRN